MKGSFNTPPKKKLSQPQVENCCFGHSHEVLPSKKKNVCEKGVNRDHSTETHKIQVAKWQRLLKRMAHGRFRQPTSWVTLSWCCLSKLYSNGDCIFRSILEKKKETFTVKGVSALKGCKHGASRLRTVWRISKCWLRPTESPAYLRDTLEINYTE